MSQNIGVKSEAETRNAIRVIESLRAGIPTRMATRLLPDLRKSVTDRVVQDLELFGNGSIPAGRMLWGQYGQGKTHALTTIEHQALDRNFAVSRVSLSREVSCHHLFNFYGQVAPRIRTPVSSLEGVQPCLSKIRPDDLQGTVLFEEERYTSPLPRIVLEDSFLADGEDKEKLLGDLSGVRLPVSEIARIHRFLRGSVMRKQPFKVTEHAEAYFGVMSDAIRLGGFEGWVILIDEIELLGRLGKLSRLKAYLNLYRLLNWDGSRKWPIYVVAAAASRLEDDLWYGRSDDDRTIMPELAAQKLGDKAARDVEKFFSLATGSGSMHIQPPKAEDLLQLLARVAELHGQAYGWTPEFSGSELLRHLGAQPVRTYVRAALEALDLRMLHGMEQIPDAGGLMDVTMEPEAVEEADLDESDDGVDMNGQ